MKKLIEDIVKKYRRSYERCRNNPVSEEAAGNNYITITEEMCHMGVSERLREESYAGHILEEDEEEREKQHIGMCGCRLTAKLMFMLLYLGTKNITKEVKKEIVKLYESENPVNLIINSGFTERRTRGIVGETIASIARGEFIDGIDYSLPDEKGLYLVQILKNYGFGYQPFHTFVIYNNKKAKSYIITSWYSGGGEEEATELDYQEGPREDVSEFLLGIEDNERKNESWQQMAVNLFNNEIPKGEYRIIYFSSEYIGKMLSLRDEHACIRGGGRDTSRSRKRERTRTRTRKRERTRKRRKNSGRDKV